MSWFEILLLVASVFAFSFIKINVKPKEDDPEEEPVLHIFSVEKYNDEYFVYNEQKDCLFVTQQKTISDVFEYVIKNNSGLISVVAKDKLIAEELSLFAKEKNLQKVDI